MEQNRLKLLQVRSTIQALLVFGSVILLQVVGYILWIAVCMLFHYETARNTMLMQISIVSALLALLWCGYLYWRSDWRVHPFDYKAAFSIKNIGAIVLLGTGGCMVVTFLLALLQSTFPKLFVNYVQTMNQFLDGEMVITFLYVLLIGPIAEEMIFRGAILDRLYLAFPFWMANLLQAALFALYHMNLVQGIYAFIWGLILGLVRQAVGSILASMLAHILFNTTNYLLDYMFPSGEQVLIPLFLGTFLVGIIFFVVGLWYTIQTYEKNMCE